MSTELLVIVTIGEIVALVAVLALFLIAIAARLRSIDGNLDLLASGLQEVDGHVAAIAPTAGQINQPLDDIVDTLPQVAREAEKLAAR